MPNTKGEQIYDNENKEYHTCKSNVLSYQYIYMYEVYDRHTLTQKIEPKKKLMVQNQRLNFFLKNKYVIICYTKISLRLTIILFYKS